MQLLNARPLLVLTLILLGLALLGCATPSAPAPCVCPAIPPAPALSEPIPSVSYSLNAAGLIKTWREKLTGTPATP